MDLFSDSKTNLLPFDGEAYYYGNVLSFSDAARYLALLLETIKWRNDELIFFGKKVVTKRKVAWYADEPFEYTYSNTTKQAEIWTKELIELKGLVEEYTHEKYNSCLLNLYHSGEEGMSWHTDAEKELKKHGSIASLSLGADRKFSFKHKIEKCSKSIVLENGSLLEMKGTTQENWLHCLPKTKKNIRLRINLTFRTINNSF